MNKKTFVFTAILFLLASSAVFAQTENALVLPKPGITPESNFYFLDKFGEALREFFTFSPEGRARLQIVFAAERVAEIKIILETKGVEADGLTTAHSRLLAHLADATTILADEKADGNDVSGLAKELDDAFEGPKTALEAAFLSQKRALEAEEDALKIKIKEARRAGDGARVEALLKQLDEIKAQKEGVEQKEEEQEEALEREEERLEEEMEERAEVGKKIQKAERKKREILDETARDGVSLPPETFNAFDRHIAEAKSALAAGAFDTAKHHAEEAKESLKAVADAFEDLEEAKKGEEELLEEQEEQEQEARERQDEDMRKDTEKALERFEEEQKKAEEKIRKAEDRLREAGAIDENNDENDD